jgi:hypothetical protein
MTIREFREENELSGRDVVKIIQQSYPKFNKAALSYAENFDKTGVTLTSKAKTLLFESNPEYKRKMADGHRLKCRLSTRVTEDEFCRFNALREEDGRFSTTQDFLKFIVTEYMKSHGRYSVYNSAPSGEQKE